MNKFLQRLSNFLGGEKALRAIAGSSDIALAFFIICIIMMLIFRVSPHVIDVLISVNLTSAILVLFTALYILRQGKSYCKQMPGRLFLPLGILL